MHCSFTLPSLLGNARKDRLVSYFREDLLTWQTISPLILETVIGRKVDNSTMTVGLVLTTFLNSLNERLADPVGERHDVSVRRSTRTFTTLELLEVLDANVGVLDLRLGILLKWETGELSRRDMR